MQALVGKLRSRKACFYFMLCSVTVGFGIYFVILTLEPVHFVFSSVYHQQACSLPKLNPFDASIQKLFWKPDALVCDTNPSLVYVDDFNKLQWNLSALAFYAVKETDVVCEILKVVRNPDDYNIEFSEPVTVYRLPTNLTVDFNHVICRTKSNRVLYDNIVHGIKTKKLAKVNDSSKEEVTPSVLFFGIDSVSRSASIRYLPKTRQFLEELGAYDFKGYMKVGDNTLPNFLALLTGKRLDNEECPNYRERRFDDYPFLWKNVSSLDYVTMFAEDVPHMGCFTNGLKGFFEPPTDHYMRPFWLALAKHDSVQYKLSGVYRFLEDKGVKVKKSSVFCNQNTPNHVVLMNYLRQFFQRYRGQRKFALSFLTELAHTFINFLNYGDDVFVDFFKWLKTEGFLDNTVLIVFSDHGARFENMRNTFVGRIESRMPLLSMVIPEKLKKRFPSIHKSLEINTERLVTAFDIHQTVIDIATGNFDKPSKQLIKDRVRGVSLFQPISKERSCHDAWIPEEFCACYKSTSVDIAQDKDIQWIGEKIVDHINNLLSNYKLCKKLALSKVLSADFFSLGLKHTGTSHNGYSFFRFMKPEKNRRRYSISVETNPGFAIFDASCEFTTPSDFQVIGSIDRTNKYGNQSYCVSNEIIKQYCYC